MAPIPPNVRTAAAKPWRSSTPPNVRTAAAKPWRSSTPPTFGPLRRNRRGPFYNPNVRIAAAKPRGWCLDHPMGQSRPTGRVSIPAKFRGVLAQFDGMLIVVPNGSALEVHPFESWQRLESRMHEKSRFDADVRKFGRLYISNAKEVSLDGAGRILLPPDTREKAGLEKDVTVVGLGLDFFEVWDRARF